MGVLALAPLRALPEGAQGAQLKQLKDSRVLRLAEKKRRVAELQNDVNKAQFWYRAYDENTMALMAERLPFVTANPYFIVVNCHAALTLELAKLVMRMCVSGSNPTDLERMLGEFHQGSFFSELKEYLQWHLWAKNQKGQITLVAGVTQPCCCTESRYAMYPNTSSVLNGPVSLIVR